MQVQFGFCGHDEIARWSAALSPLVAGADQLPRRKPIGQLVKSMISGRTRDPVSLRAYRRLRERYGAAARIAAAKPQEIENTIADVTFPESKAKWLVGALRRIGRERPDYRLDFLGELPLDQALVWLERLPGVGRKVAASTLNASTLNRPMLIVDGHVQRVLCRLGLVAADAGARDASEVVTAAMPDWSGDDFLRFHIGANRLGQRICRPETPDCAACPLAADCRARLT
ncbi:endonuclease [Sphingomonas sp. G-3-2-10]|uniref:endonuclease III domain-containing protein n=1 Tax=Sphingomonas sp. G-3-2-10 TaxID=2728838 RepID=UPI00146E8C0C|nr:endonuclease [Sphingomonas sp. G-3-2-10]NML07958.1 endonuclease [Sphingomonas sp. G-3-2-10]